MERNRGLDLLRLLAGMAVVMLHYNFGHTFKMMDEIPFANRMLLYGMETLCVPAVNIFMLISGYFLYRSEKRSIGKIINLLILVVVAKEVFYLGPVLLGRHPFEWNLFLENLVPRFYFIILYIAVYLISPYINILLKKITTKSAQRLILLLLIILSVEPWLVDVFERLTGRTWLGLGMISFYGGGGGQTLVQFVLMYIIGASIYKFKEADCHHNVKWGGVYIVASLLIFMSYTVLSPWVSSPYYSPFVILQSVALFYMFLKINCAKVFSKLSKAALTCYIIHWPLLNFLNIEYYTKQPTYILAIQIFVSLVAIYLFSFAFMIIYDFVFKKPQGSLNRITVDYFLDSIK